MNLKDDWIYWICQIAGWGSYSTVVFAVVTAFAGWHTYIFLGFVLFFCYSIGLTHLSRRHLRKREWLALPGFSGLRRIFGAALAIGGLQTLLIILIARVLSGQNAFDANATAGTALLFKNRNPISSFWTSKCRV